MDNYICLYFLLVSYDKDTGWGGLITGLTSLPNLTQDAQAAITQFVNSGTSINEWAIMANNDFSSLATTFGYTDESFAGWLKSINDSQTSFGTAEEAMQSYQKYLKTTGNEAVVATTKTKLLSTAMKALSTIGIMVAMTAISSAISSVVSALEDYSKRTETANKAMAESASAFDDTTSSVESLKWQIEDCTARLAELYELAESGDITVVEEEELENLEAQNRELERQLKLLEEQQRLEAQEMLNATNTALGSTVLGTYTFQNQNLTRDENGNVSVGTSTTGIGYVTQAEEFDAAIQKAYELHEQILQLQEDYNNLDFENMTGEEFTRATEEYESALADLEDRLNSVRQDTSNYASVISDAIDAYNYATDAGFELTASEQENLDVCNDLWDAYSGLLDILNSTSNGLEDVADSADDASKAEAELKEYSAKDIFGLTNIDGDLNKLGELNDQLDTIQSAYKTLTDAMDTYDETGMITIDQLQAIIATGDDFLDYLTLEEGALGVDEEAMYDLAAARLYEMEAQIEQGLIDNVTAIYDEASAAEYLESTNYALATSYHELAEAQLEAWATSANESGEFTAETVDAVVNKATNDLAKIRALFNNVSIGSTSLSGGTSGTSSGRSSSSSAAEDVDDYAEEIDFFTRRVQVLSDAYDLLATNIDNVIGASAKNQLVDAQYDIAAEKLNNYTDALAMYQQKANEALSNIPTEYIDKVVNGAVDITEFLGEANEEVVDAINDYNDWADKIADCTANIAELKTQLRQLELDKFNNIVEQYNNIISLYDTGNDNIQKQISLLEEAGEVIGEGFYTTLIEQTNKELSALQEEREALSKQLSSSLSSGRIQEGTDEWLEMVSALEELDGEILDCEKSVEEFQNAILQLHWDNLDRIADSFSNINNEISNIIGLLENHNDVVDFTTGEWTSAGIAELGLYAQQYELARYEVEMYAKEIEQLDKDYAAGKYSATEYADKLAELNDLQWDAVNAAESAEQAIISLNQARVDAIEDLINEEISAYKELTNQKKAELSAEEELYNRRQKIEEQTKAITDIEKQIAAVQGDTTLAGQAQLNKLYEELAEAQQNLADTEFSYSIQDQSDALDAALEDFTAIKEAEIDTWEDYIADSEQVIYDSFETVKENALEVADTLTEIAEEHGVVISDAIISSWQAGENALASYGEALDSSSSAFISNIMGVENQVYQLQKDADTTSTSLASMFATSANKLVSELTTSYNSVSNLNSVTNALKSSLVDTLQSGYNVSSVTSSINSVKSSLDSATSSAKSLASALKEVGAQQEAVNSSSSSSSSSSSGYYDIVLPNGTIQSGRYASGTKNAKRGWAVIDEEGINSEMVLSPITSGRYRFMEGGEQVIPKEEADNLWRYSAITPEELIQRTVDMLSDHLATSEDYSVQNYSASPSLSVGNMVSIQTSAIDESSIPMIENVVNNTVEGAFKRFDKEINKRRG